MVSSDGSGVMKTCADHYMADGCDIYRSIIHVGACLTSPEKHGEIINEKSCVCSEKHTYEALRFMRYGVCSKFETSVAMAGDKLTHDARRTSRCELSEPPCMSRSMEC